MKNILNLSTISLKPIFMSLAILFTTGVSFPNHFEKVVSASYPNGQTYRIVPNIYPYEISEKEYDVPELPLEYNGKKVIDVKVEPFCNGNIFLNVRVDKDTNNYFFVNAASPKPKEVQKPQTDDLTGEESPSKSELCGCLLI